MPIAITIYKCEFCGKRRLSNKSKVAEHEKKCWYNPENKSCPSCVFNSYEDSTAYCFKHDKTREINTKPTANCVDWALEFNLYEG